LDAGVAGGELILERVDFGEVVVAFAAELDVGGVGGAAARKEGSEENDEV
jgi:hypothetical protein